MARFRGTVKGNRGEASRLGHKTSGLSMRANSWNGRICVYLFDRDGEDWAHVHHEDAKGNATEIYRGPLAKCQPQRKIEKIELWDEDNHYPAE